MSGDIRPVPGDPSASTVMEMVDLHSEEWIAAAAGDYSSAAVEAMKFDGTNYQRLIAIEYPGRKLHTGERVTVRLLINPEDAVGLANVLVHTARWLEAAERLGR